MAIELVLRQEGSFASFGVQDGNLSMMVCAPLNTVFEIEPHDALAIASFLGGWLNCTVEEEEVDE